MIPRFNYSYSVRDAWETLVSVRRGPTPDTSYLRTLFPASAIYAVSSARAGINYALHAFDLKPGARVGVQPYTCSSVLSAITAAGYRPVFIDINQQLSIDTTDLRRKLPFLDALIVTHTFGIPANIAVIKQLTGRIPVIEDCAHAFLSRYKGTPVGNFFNAAVFSFGNGKFPSFGGGGLLVVNTATYAEAITARLIHLPLPGFMAELGLVGKRLMLAMVHSRAGGGLMQRLLTEATVSNRNKQPLNFPVGEALPVRSITHALQRQFERLIKKALRQWENARYLTEHTDGAYTMLFDKDAGNAFAVVLVAEDRNELYTYLRSKGIGAGKHFQHAREWALAFGYVPGECPNFEELVDKILTVPCHDQVTQNELKKINHCLGEYARLTRSIHEENSGRY